MGLAPLVARFNERVSVFAGCYGAGCAVDCSGSTILASVVVEVRVGSITVDTGHLRSVESLCNAKSLSAVHQAFYIYI
jgi:hypothetical protein